ncbi:MAG: DUF1351 domain-containing protein [Parasporobacterium sp.]|nr:DUF1351 domain-containing protein [Parasporobacterium sp.]
MEALQIVQMENADITTWDLPAIKAELQKRLDEFAGLVYTADTIKDAKNDRALLNKAKKTIEDARKAYKAKCLEPYEAIEPQIKELTDMVDHQRVLIDETVKEFETAQKAEKEQEVRAYYDRKSSLLGEYADDLYSKLFDPKWLNASTSRAKYEEAIQSAINQAAGDIAAVKAMNSPFVDTLLKIYLETLSLDAVRTKKDELSAAAAAAGMTSEQQADEPPAIESRCSEVVGMENVNPEAGTAMKIYANQSQLNQITDFMKAIGVHYEFL